MNKFGKIFLSLLLAFAVLFGAYFGLQRFLAESASRQVQLAVDLNDIKKMAAFEKQPIGPILEEVRKLGISGIGVFEETLPDATVLGDAYYASGAGVSRLNLLKVGDITPESTYIYVPNEKTRKRIYNQLCWALGSPAVHFSGNELLVADEPADELRDLGLGISEIQQNFLLSKGFQIVPRVWNDPHYHLGNIGQKLSGLSGYQLIIFDRDEILGYPDAIPSLAEAMKKNKIKYGYVEIVKQSGDQRLRKLMGSEAVRVHSVPKDELKKITREEALDRFVRAARERSVRLIYLRPFLPPKIDAYPVAYNLEYFKLLKNKLEAAGFVLGPTESEPVLKIRTWQLVILGTGVLIGTIFLIDAFVPIPIYLMYLILLAGVALITLMGEAGQILMLQKALALMAAVIFPASAIITTFSAKSNLKNASAFILNMLAETGIGIFLMIGLLADSIFMQGIEVFPAVKTALILPIIIVVAYFILKSGEGNVLEKVRQYARTQVSLLSVIIGAILLGALAVLVARSGNFSLPVPGFEKYFRNWLEMILFVRPRTKEFLVGYPVLYLAAIYYLRGEKKWLWILAAIGAIAPTSVFNTFSHIHTPLVVSFIRTFNGLVLGIIIGVLVWWIVQKFNLSDPSPSGRGGQA